MDALMALILVITSLVAFGALAVRFGVDSRPSVGDDYARPLSH